MLIVYCFIVLQKVYEFTFSHANIKWLISKGGNNPVKGSLYSWILFLQALFFSSILIEANIGNAEQELNFFGCALLPVIFAGRLWCMSSKGKFWNAQNVCLPGVLLMRSGPYRYIKHPDHWLLAIELILIPILFGAYVTLFLFLLLHTGLLIVKLPEDERKPYKEA